jgi:hypothetical protein
MAGVLTAPPILAQATAAVDLRRGALVGANCAEAGAGQQLRLQNVPVQAARPPAAPLSVRTGSAANAVLGQCERGNSLRATMGVTVSCVLTMGLLMRVAMWARRGGRFALFLPIFDLIRNRRGNSEAT